MIKCRFTRSPKLMSRVRIFALPMYWPQFCCKKHLKDRFLPYFCADFWNVNVPFSTV